MAFNTNPGKQQFAASAGQTIFTFNFAIFADTDLKVYKTLAGATPDDTADIITLTTHYTVSINGTLGGTITLLSGAAINDTITIARSLPIGRSTDYVTNGDLLADTLDLDQDYQTYLTADADVKIQRAIIVPESLGGVNLNIPSPVSDSYLRWNTAADALENDTAIPTAVTTSAANAAAALISQNAAAVSAADALTYLNGFKGTYYGALASDPIVDPLGNAITVGDVYYNSTSNELRYYNGAWVVWNISEADLASLLHALASKAIPVDNDEFVFLDSEATFGLKKLTYANLKAAQKTYNDTLYAAIGSNIAGVRQTVQSGRVDTNGFANFLSIGTGLNVNIAATTTHIKVHAAGGAISNDRLGTISADKTLLLPASSTSYIYESVGTDGVCTSGSTALAPIYQFGGTPAVTNGQFTFNIGEMKGYLGNGTTAPQVWLTFTGQATTDTTTVTSVINYALNGVYISGFFNVAANVVYSKNHNLGIQNFIVNIDYKFATTGGTIYAVGDICDMKWSQLAANTSITSRQKTKTSYSVKTYNNTFVGQEDGAGATISKTDGAYNFIIIRGW